MYLTAIETSELNQSARTADNDFEIEAGARHFVALRGMVEVKFLRPPLNLLLGQTSISSEC